MMATVGELSAPGPYRRFIVKFHPDSVPGRDPRAVQPRLERAAAASALMLRDEDTPLAISWQRRLAVMADVVQAERPLDRDEAQRLLDALAQDPDVEYVEADAIMRAAPGPARRPD